MLRMIYATIIIFTYLISVLKVDTEQPLFIYLFILLNLNRLMTYCCQKYRRKAKFAAFDVFYLQHACCV